MKPINPRTAEETYEFHRTTPIEIYSLPIHSQCGRIEVSRNMAARTLRELPQKKANEQFKVIELGCGTADISGWVSENYKPIIARAYESAQAPAVVARQRWPRLTVRVGDLQQATPEFCDLLIMCEILEHLAHPVEIVARWGRRAKSMIVSHPIDEALDSKLSEGRHVWSLSTEDWENWFTLAGHQVVEQVELKIGHYNILVGRGKADGK